MKIMISNIDKNPIPHLEQIVFYIMFVGQLFLLTLTSTADTAKIKNEVQFRYRAVSYTNIDPATTRTCDLGETSDLQYEYISQSRTICKVEKLIDCTGSFSRYC